MRSLRDEASAPAPLAGWSWATGDRVGWAIGMTKCGMKLGKMTHVPGTGLSSRQQCWPFGAHGSIQAVGPPLDCAVSTCGYWLARLGITT
eukprot:scaffold35211_cov112-Isochrysis_galbana.AAC.4